MPELQSDDEIRSGGFVLLGPVEMKSDVGEADNKAGLCSAMMLGEMVGAVDVSWVWSVVVWFAESRGESEEGREQVLRQKWPARVNYLSDGRSDEKKTSSQHRAGTTPAALTGPTRPVGLPSQGLENGTHEPAPPMISSCHGNDGTRAASHCASLRDGRQTQLVARRFFFSVHLDNSDEPFKGENKLVVIINSGPDASCFIPLLISDSNMTEAVRLSR